MSNWPDHIVDIAVLVLIVLSGGLAFFRGFVHEVLAVAGWVGAIFAAWYGYGELSPYLQELIANKKTADIAAGIILFVVTLALLSLFTRAVSRRVQESALNAVDRSLGFLFGIVRGGVIVCLGWMLISWTIPPEDQPGWLTNTRTAPLAEKGAKILRGLAPNSERAGAKAADDAKSKLKGALDGGKLFEQLVVPPPAKGKDEAQGGYSSDDRKKADELMKQTQ